MFKDDFALQAQPAPAPVERGLPWIGVAPGAPYFQTEDGAAWHPIGSNDAISWKELEGLFRRRDLPAVDRYLGDLARNGVTMLRLMLEYAQVRHRYFERPAGHFPPSMVRLWDDMFALCEKHGLRLLLTPVDTFWTWLHWRHHPYNRANGGPLSDPSQILLCRDTRALIKGRLEFAVRRWGGSGALFAWDLWNEIHPAQGADSADCFPEFIADLSNHVRRLELNLYGRSHPQTVSIFGPELEWRGHLPMTEPIFRHPDLDFATIHVYQMGTIDDPQDTVAPALDMARHVRAHLAEITDGRPYCDSEHGPIHRFKDKKQNLPEAFDDEYFRHMQWAHLAAGGAGGGMRWPNRNPHRLTDGMRREQGKLAAFLPHLDWLSFRRESIDVAVDSPGRVHAMACGDDRQALVYLLRGDALRPDGMLDRSAPALDVAVSVPCLADGEYQATLWDTLAGQVRERMTVRSRDGTLHLTATAFQTDLILAIRPA